MDEYTCSRYILFCLAIIVNIIIVIIILIIGVLIWRLRCQKEKESN